MWDKNCADGAENSAVSQNLYRANQQNPKFRANGFTRLRLPR